MVIEPLSRSGGRISSLEIPVAWCRLDARGSIVDLNSMFMSLFERGGMELRGKSFETLCADDETSFKSFIRNFPNCGALSFRAWLKRSEDIKFPAIIHAVGESHGDEKPEINLVVLDDSFNYAARERAKYETENSRQKEQLKNEFIAIASHELRTPIQPILGFALLAKKGKIPPEQAWDGILKEARRLQQLANDILDVSRIEAYQISYKMEPLRINDLVQNIVDSARTDLKKDLSFELSFEKADQEIVADRSRITQAISNLVNNSIKFTSSGALRVSSRLLAPDGPLEIRVRDSGPGIPVEMLPRLFTKFTTKDHGEAVSNSGTGLGLFICKSIVTAHKGSIEARNVPEGGAEFIITLPLKQK